MAYVLRGFNGVTFRTQNGKILVFWNCLQIVQGQVSLDVELIIPHATSCFWPVRQSISLSVFRIGEFSVTVGNDIISILQVPDVKYSYQICLDYSSKSDHHRKGVTVTINDVDRVLCTVRCLQDSLMFGCKSDWPLFVHLRGKLCSNEASVLLSV